MPRHRTTFAGPSSDPVGPAATPSAAAHPARRGAPDSAVDTAGTLVVDSARAALDTLPEAWRRTLGDLRAAHDTAGHTRHAGPEHIRSRSARASSSALAERHDPRLRQLAATGLDASWRHELALRIDTTSPHRVIVDRGDDYQASRLGDRARQRAAAHIEPCALCTQLLPLFASSDAIVDAANAWVPDRRHRTPPVPYFRTGTSARPIGAGVATAVVAAATAGPVGVSSAAAVAQITAGSPLTAISALIDGLAASLRRSRSAFTRGTTIAATATVCIVSLGIGTSIALSAAQSRVAFPMVLAAGQAAQAASASPRPAVPAEPRAEVFTKPSTPPGVPAEPGREQEPTQPVEAAPPIDGGGGTPRTPTRAPVPRRDAPVHRPVLPAGGGSTGDGAPVAGATDSAAADGASGHGTPPTAPTAPTAPTSTPTTPSPSTPSTAGEVTPPPTSPVDPAAPATTGASAGTAANAAGSSATNAGASASTGSAGSTGSTPTASAGGNGSSAGNGTAGGSGSGSGQATGPTSGTTPSPNGPAAHNSGSTTADSGTAAGESQAPAAAPVLPVRPDPTPQANVAAPATPPVPAASPSVSGAAGPTLTADGSVLFDASIRPETAPPTQ